MDDALPVNHPSATVITNIATEVASGLDVPNSPDWRLEQPKGI
jgi:hypothetical protein